MNDIDHLITMQCNKTLGPLIHVNVTLTRTVPPIHVHVQYREVTKTETTTQENRDGYLLPSSLLLKHTLLT